MQHLGPWSIILPLSGGLWDAFSRSPHQTSQWVDAKARSTLGSYLQGIQLPQHPPGMWRKLFLSHCFLKEQDNFLLESAILSAPGQRGSVCWGCLCPVSLRKGNITTECFCGCSTQLWVFGAQERFIQSWRHNSIQGYPGEIVQKLSFDCNGPWNNLKERNGKKKERRKETEVREEESNVLLTKNIHIHHTVDPSLWEAGEGRSSAIILI